MMFTDTTERKNLRGSAALAILVAVSLVGIAYPSYAQGLSAAQQGIFDLSQGANPNQDQLLPPAVVPIDPNAASKNAHQSARELDLEVNNGQGFNAQNQAANQHMNLHPASSGYMTHQEKRQALMNSLMQPNNGAGNGYQITQPYNNSNYGQMQANNLAPSYNQNQGQSLNQPLAQPDWLAPQAQQVNAFGNVPQTQTLTASSSNPIVRRDTRRGGMANNLAGALTLGSGLFTGGLKRPNSIMGLGTTALFMTGFGRR